MTAPAVGETTLQGPLLGRGGLLEAATVGWAWADPVAGFVIAVFAVREGREAWAGELCCD